MANKFGLGRGAESVFGSIKNEENNQAQDSSTKASEKAAVEKTEQSVPKNLPSGINSDENGQLWVSVDLLKPNPHQPRKEFEEEPLNELADSIREHGILQSITIQDAGDGTFYIIAGERRTRAAKIAGLSEVPVQLRKYNEQKQLEMALIENIQRQDLNPIEEAEAYYELMELSGLSQEQVAARVGKNRSTVANAVRLLKLPEDMRSSLVQGHISAGHARALLSVKDSADMRILFAKIIGNSMNVREAEDMARSLNEGAGNSKKTPKIPKDENKDPNITELEQKFIEKLGTKVQIKGNMERGSLEVQFFTKDDLNRIYYLICGQE
ncbi:MAG: ParB/RepB/Spo0J family partition protein [Treponema sp.]|nr:ParB/RepB/Spo0J family partition protein [Treponema sp.]